MRKLSFLSILLLLAPLLVGGQAAGSPVQAQGSMQWTVPQRIPNYSDQGQPPILVADPSGTVHALNYEVRPEQATGEIYYRRWSAELGWEPPVDILIPSQGAAQATVQAAILNEPGMLSLVYYDGSELIGDMYFTQAYAPVANRARSWTRPVPVGSSAGPLVTAALLQDRRGRILLLYGGQQDGIGLYQVVSMDEGKTWSAPVAVDLINEPERWPFGVKMIEGADGSIHATWAVVSKEGLGLEVRYAHLDVAGRWSSMRTLATRDEGDYSTSWPNLVEWREQLILIYQDSFPATRWMRTSKDGGATWSTPVRPFPEIGEYGAAALVKDSQENLYMMLGNRTGDPEIHGMWFSRWLGTQWTAIRPIVSGPATKAFDPSRPQAVVVRGNLALVTWWNDIGGDNLNGIWYAYAQLDAPQTAARAFPTPTQGPARTQDGTPLPDGVSATPLTTALSPENAGGPPPPPTNPAFPVWAGILPVLFLVIAVAAWRTLRSSA